MNGLFLDSTSHLCLGLLDDGLEWKKFIKIQEAKNSSIFHQNVYDLLHEFNLKIREVDYIIWIAGPGSYTGMRLTQGFTQIQDWVGVANYSFFHFDIPKLVGVTKGRWVSNAFKQEFFSYTWDEKEENCELVSNSNWSEKDNTFTHCQDFWTLGRENLAETVSLIEEKPKEIFSQVLEKKSQVSPYYFRPLEQEFKVPERLR